MTCPTLRAALQAALNALPNNATLYRYHRQPYYIVAPSYADHSAGIRLMHELCSLLNQLGFEAHMHSPKTSGTLWTPSLSSSARLAHWRAGKKPIVLCPEAVKGKDLGMGLHVRYLPGTPEAQASPDAAQPSELVFQLGPDVLCIKGWPQELTAPDTPTERWRDDLLNFIDRTQSAAHAADFDQVWPAAAVDAMEGSCETEAENAARADRQLWRRLEQQYRQWQASSTPREIDAHIYAEHWHAGRALPLQVVIDQRHASPDALADTLDSLGQCLGQAAGLHIVAADAPPPEWQGLDDVHWHDTRLPHWQQHPDLPHGAHQWLLLLRSGCRLSPRALMEWGLAAKQAGLQQLIYADEDLYQPPPAEGADDEAPPRHPFFKPDANVELLRCMNYLGDAVALRADTWAAQQHPLPGAELYATALQLLASVGRPSLGHIDTVLSHTAPAASHGSDQPEWHAAQRLLHAQGVAEHTAALPRWGTWLPQHTLHGAPSVSLVVSTGMQTGFLRHLLQSLQQHQALALHEAILVCHSSQRSEVERASLGACQARIHILAWDDPHSPTPPSLAQYNHAHALNLGAQHAQGEFLLLTDDDIEAVHDDWLQRLVAIAQQADVGCVAPRLLAPPQKGAEPRVMGGPVFLGFNGTAGTYRGEEGRLDEVGVYSRLQLSQDVSAVAGHCLVLRRSHWVEAGGLRAERYPLFLGVLDLCLRLSAQGLRHVWTPLSQVAHHGGKTLAVLRHDLAENLRLTQAELAEREQALIDWAGPLARDPHYNRHLSLRQPFDIESDIVIDWNPQRRDRPRILAMPTHGGSGDYRVKEPLHAVQDAGWAQTATVRSKRQGRRILQPLELRRAAPDLLLLQYSTDDNELNQVARYHLAAPDVVLAQAIDDLVGNVPDKHPSRAYNTREGHRRMRDAMRACDRLIVSTEPLREHSLPYNDDVRLVPNTLSSHWFEHTPTRHNGPRLRVGWVGAGQHQGDLELIADLVREFAPEVDWVFMGMCIDAIRPHIKEFHDFVPFAEYPAKMASLALDIALAPIEDHIFNRCKSNLRLLEYGAMGWPVLCSDVYPYRTNNPPVLHCRTPEEWRNHLRRLIDDAALRQQLGQSLHSWVRQHYYLPDWSERWFQALLQPAHATAKTT